MKMQLSAGLVVERLDAGLAEKLREFDDGVYLHQVVERAGERINRYDDLPEALATFTTGAEVAPQWRVHCHVPLFMRELGPFANTQDFLATMLDGVRARPITDHLEVETYTWSVLPDQYRGASVVDDVARELAWVVTRLTQ
jgi:hypothetical protein